jgi:succinoglycan biosynthesis protein ExoM
MTLSVCIATYRRAPRLAALLDDLVAQRDRPDEVVVVDNDRDASALAVVQRRRAQGAPFPIRYAVQPVKNISLTRNRCIDLAAGDWLAFIDDDERVPVDWLERLRDTQRYFDVDGVLGPVEPVIPPDSPAWIRRGGFYRWARMPTGTAVPPNKLRFGNVMLRAALLRAHAARFDPAYGLTGGEDGDLLVRLVQAGAFIVWCDEAVVLEPVEASRLSVRWLLMRALSGGQSHARHRVAGRYGPLTGMGRLRYFARALAQATAAAALALLTWPSGRHRAVGWLMRAAANVGKMSILVGWHHRGYAGEAA